MSTTLDMMQTSFYLKDLTDEQKIIALRSRIQTLTLIEEVECKCNKAKLPELFHIIKSIKFESQCQLNELTE